MGVLRLVVAHQLGSPAIYKLLVGGVAWVHPDTMNESMTAELPWQKTTGGAFNRFSLKVDWLVNFMTDHPALELLSGTVALLFEFSAIPVCLFGDSDLLFVFMFMCSVFHLSIVPLTGVVFPYHLLCYAPLLLDYTVIAPSPDCFHNIPSLLACALLCASSAVGLEDWPINAIAVFPYNGQQIRLLKRHMGIFRFSHSGANKQTTDTCVAETCCCKCAVSYDPDFIAQFDLDEHPTQAGADDSSQAASLTERRKRLALFVQQSKKFIDPVTYTPFDNVVIDYNISEKNTADSAKEAGRPRLCICVLGTGVSGIGIGRVLKHNPLFEVHIYERQGRVGGVWSWNKYEDLSLQTKQERYTYPGDDWPYKIQGHPTGRQVTEYLESVVKRYNLQVFYGSDIESIKLGPAGRYRLQPHVEPHNNVVYDLVIQTSESTVPHVPPQVSNARYSWCHSSDLDSQLLDEITATYQTVVVCGGNKSAYEAVHSFAKRRKRVTWVCRRLYHVYAPDDHRIWKQPLHDRSTLHSQGNTFTKNGVAACIQYSELIIDPHLVIGTEIVCKGLNIACDFVVMCTGYGTEQVPLLSQDGEPCKIEQTDSFFKAMPARARVGTNNSSGLGYSCLHAHFQGVFYNTFATALYHNRGISHNEICWMRRRAWWICFWRYLLAEEIKQYASAFDSRSVLVYVLCAFTPVVMGIMIMS